MDILEKTKQDYNIIAPHFSEKRRFIWKDLKPFLKLVNPKDKVLDAGCGNARLYKELKNKKIDYLGIDFSEKILEIAKKNHPEAKFKLADLTQEKTWKDLKNFDICFCLASFHHLENKNLHLKVLNYINKALKDEGLLVISVWNLWQKRFWSLHLKQLAWKITRGFKLKWLKVPYKVSDGQKIVRQVNRFCYAFNKKELEEIVKKAGFSIKKRKYNHNLCLVAKKMIKSA